MWIISIQKLRSGSFSTAEVPCSFVPSSTAEDDLLDVCLAVAQCLTLFGGFDTGYHGEALVFSMQRRFPDTNYLDVHSASQVTTLAFGTSLICFDGPGSLPAVSLETRSMDMFVDVVDVKPLWPSSLIERLRNRHPNRTPNAQDNRR